MQYPNAQTPWPPAPNQPAEKRKFGRLQALVLSFLSAELYRDVARRWRGIGFLYMVLLTLLVSIPTAIKAHRDFAWFAQHDAPTMVQDFPSITISNGKVSSDRDPYVWRDPKSGDAILYVDTSGAFDLPEGKKAHAKLSESKLEIRKNSTETQTYDLKDVKSFSIDKTRLGGWVDAVSHWVGPGLFALLFVGGIIWRLIQCLLYAVIGLIIASMVGATLSFGALMRLAAVAITPAVLLGLAADLAGVNVPYAALIYLVIELAYLAFAIKASAVPQTPGMYGGFPAVGNYGANPGGFAPPAGGYGAPPAQYPPPQYPPPPYQPPQYPQQ